MRGSVVGMVVAIIVAFISLILLPAYFIGIINWRTDMNTCQNCARNFVDMVIDNGQITDRALSDLNLGLASCSSTFTYEVYKEERVTNPDPANPGKIKIEWVTVDLDSSTVWNTGDLVTIVITQKDRNIFQRISSMMIGMSYNNMEVRLTGMVR